MKNFSEKQLVIMEVLKNVIGIEYLARDERFGLHGFIGKPMKVGSIWDNNCGFRIGIESGYFPQILFEDDEPIELSNYIK